MDQQKEGKGCEYATGVYFESFLVMNFYVEAWDLRLDDPAHNAPAVSHFVDKRSPTYCLLYITVVLVRVRTRSEAPAGWFLHEPEANTLFSDEIFALSNLLLLRSIFCSHNKQKACKRYQEDTEKRRTLKCQDLEARATGLTTTLTD